MTTYSADGTVLKSENGGQNWQPIQIDPTATFIKIQFIDHLYGKILAFDGYIASTQDGGASWQVDSLNYDFRTNDYRWPLNDIYFTSPDTGWLAIGYFFLPNLDISAESAGALLKTENGGNYWSIVDSGDTKYSCIFFRENKTGWISIRSVNSGAKLLFTSNGGRNWDDIYYGVEWQILYFDGANHGFGISGTYLGKTNDGGVNWEVQEYMDPPAPESGYKNL